MPRKMGLSIPAISSQYQKITPDCYILPLKQSCLFVHTPPISFIIFTLPLNADPASSVFCVIYFELMNTANHR
jgi:hypothetical protein